MSLFDLQIFADGGEESAAGSTPAASSAGTGTAPKSAGTATYSFEQAEEIANARADRASKAALANYFKQQGMNEEEVTKAIDDFKLKKAAASPDVKAITKERDDAIAKIAMMENTSLLRDKGVKAEDLDYVLFKVSQMVNDDTDFSKATDAFLKENPRFVGQIASTYKVSTSTPSGGSDASGTSKNPNDAFNAAIRKAAAK